MEPIERSPGQWHVSVPFPGKVAMLNMEGGELPKGSFAHWPIFDSKEKANAFLEEIQAQK